MKNFNDFACVSPALLIGRGCVVAVKEKRFIPFSGRPWADHFAECTVYYAVKDNPTNNGNFKGYTHGNRMAWINTHDVSKVFDRSGNLLYWNGSSAPVYTFTEE